MKNAQTSLEGLLVIATWMALVGLFLAAFQSVASQNVLANEKWRAIGLAKECAGIIDALYANSGGKPAIVLHHCMPNGPHEIQIIGFAFERTAFTLAEKIEPVQQGNETVLEVKTPVHYQ